MTTTDSEIYMCPNLPVLQNKVYATEEEAKQAATGDLRLVQNAATGLIHNADFDGNLVSYDRNYQNEQACSPAFRKHLKAVANLLEDHFLPGPIIEVGCGKAVFLNMLRARGHHITGIDPAYEGDDPTIIREYFGPHTGVSAQSLVLRHVLEHIPDPVGFLADIRDANHGKGRIYIEVPCLDWIGDHKTWFDLFYEHVNYFRLGDFLRMFGSVQHAGHSFNGQYLSVIADLETLRAPVHDGSHYSFPQDFLGGIEAHAARAGRKPDSPRVVWGAASKGVIFSIFMERAGTPVNAVIDINPVKQGKHLAVTGLRVHAPEDILPTLPDGTEIIVMNDNYLEEIKNMAGSRFTYTSPT
jgi:hypothetical protein